MKCNYCQKDIEKGKEVKVNRALFTIDRTTGQRFFSAAFYHKECWQVISQKRKLESKIKKEITPLPTSQEINGR